MILCSGWTVSTNYCSTWPPVTHHSPHHLKARTECGGGNSGHLLVVFLLLLRTQLYPYYLLSSKALLPQDTWNLEMFFHPWQSLSSVTSESFIWTQLGWRNELIILCSACRFCSSPPSELRRNETAQFEWFPLQGVLFIPMSISIRTVNNEKMTKPSTHFDPQNRK